MFRRAKQNGANGQRRPQKARKLNRRLSGQRVAKRKTRIKGPPLHRVVWALVGRPVRVAGVLLLTAAGLLAGWSLVVMSPAFALQEATVEGTRHLSRLEVLRAAGLGNDDSLVALRVRPIQRRIARLPWVESVRVHRQFPHGVHIQVTERIPGMLAPAEGRIYVLDRDIRPIAELRHGPAPDLPWLTGLSRADLVKPDDETVRLMEAAGRLLRLVAERRLGTVSEVNLDRVWGLSLVLNQLAATVRLGFSHFDERLTALAKVLADLKSRGELGRVTLIDLQNHRRIVVRLGREPA